MNASSKNSGIDYPADRATITAQTARQVLHSIVVDGPGSALRVWNENTRRCNDGSLYPRGAIAFAANTQGEIIVSNGASLLARSNNYMSPTVSLGGYSGSTDRYLNNSERSSPHGRLVIDAPGEIDIRNDAVWKFHETIPYDNNTTTTGHTVLNFRNPVALRGTEYVIYRHDFLNADFAVPFNNPHSSRYIRPIEISNTLLITTWPVWDGRGLNSISPMPSTTLWSDPSVSNLWHTGLYTGSDTWDNQHNTWREILYFLGRNNARSSESLTLSYRDRLTNPTQVFHAGYTLPNPELTGTVLYPHPPQALLNNTSMQGFAHNSTDLLADRRRNTIDPVRERTDFILSDYGRIAIRGRFDPNAPRADLAVDKTVYLNPYVAGTTIIDDILSASWATRTSFGTGTTALFKISVTNDHTSATAADVLLTDVFAFDPEDSNTIISGGTWVGHNPTVTPFDIPPESTMTFYFLTPVLTELGEYENKASILPSSDYNILQGSSSAWLTICDNEVDIIKSWDGQSGMNLRNEEVFFVLANASETSIHVARHLGDPDDPDDENHGVFRFDSVPDGWYSLYEIGPPGFIPKQAGWSALVKDQREAWLDTFGDDDSIKAILKFFDDHYAGNWLIYSYSGQDGLVQINASTQEPLTWNAVDNLTTGPRLPNTGGVGSWLLMISGLSMTAIAGGSMLIRKKALSGIIRRTRAVEKRGAMNRRE